MFSNKIKITLTLGIILLLSVVSVAQAAPPLQGPSGTSQGHTLDLDPNIFITLTKQAVQD